MRSLTSPNKLDTLLLVAPVSQGKVLGKLSLQLLPPLFKNTSQNTNLRYLNGDGSAWGGGVSMAQRPSALGRGRQEGDGSFVTALGPTVLVVQPPLL